jgi:hypothetical protein
LKVLIDEEKTSITSRKNDFYSKDLMGRKWNTKKGWTSNLTLENREKELILEKKCSKLIKYWVMLHSQE